MKVFYIKINNYKLRIFKLRLLVHWTRVKKIFWPLIFPVLVIFVFAIIYLCFPSKFSVNDPKRAPHLTEALKSFFVKFCIPQNKQWVNSVSVSSDGCMFDLGRKYYTVTPGTEMGFYIKSLRVAFDSYENSVLSLRYYIEYEWVNVTGKSKDEHGMLKYDLTLLNNDFPEIQYSLNPYTSINMHLVDKVERFQYTGDLNKDMFNFPSTLSLMMLEPFSVIDLGNHHSMSNGFPKFIVKDSNEAFLELKKYFNEGVLTNLPFGRAISLSVSYFLSFGVSEVYPRTSSFRVFCAFQLFIGIIWYGYISAMFYDLLKKK